MEFTQATYEGEACVQVVFRRRLEMDADLAREVEDLRQRDQVSGLLNRPTFMVHVEDAVAQASRSEGQFGLLQVEPDHYARLLLDIGLDSADALVAALAALLSETAGSQARLARLGEHRFAVLVDGPYAATMALAERIAFARVLLHRPKLIYLDESTSALDEGNEYALYRLLRTRLPNSIMVSVTHRGAVRQHHDYHLKLQGDGRWELEREAEPLTV